VKSRISAYSNKVREKDIGSLRIPIKRMGLNGVYKLLYLHMCWVKMSIQDKC